MSEATPLHVVTSLNADGTVGDRVTFVAGMDETEQGAYRATTERSLSPGGAASIGAVVNPIIAKEIETRQGGRPDHFTITLLPNGHLNASMGLVLMVDRPAPVGPYRADIEIPLSEAEVAALDPLYAGAFASILKDGGHTLAPESAPPAESGHTPPEMGG